MALLGGGGMPPGMPPEGGAPPEGDPETLYASAMEQTNDPMTLTEWALQSARKAAQIESDDQNTLLLEQATTALAKYKATLSKEGDDMLQGKATPKAIRRMSGEVGYGA
jgi:hypothetical protein